MNLDKSQQLVKLEEEVKSFLKYQLLKQRTGNQQLHQSILEQLGLDGNDVSFPHIEKLYNYFEDTNETDLQIFIVNGIKQIVKMNYSIFSTEEKKNIYSKAFTIYKNMPEKSYFLQHLIISIFRYFYDSIQVETTFIEDVKSFCEQSVEHLQLGLQLFCNIISCMQDYQLKYKCTNDLTFIDHNSDLSAFHRKKEISFRQNLLPQIFDIPFQLLNTKREDLMSESETNFSVLLEVLNLLYECLNYDYFDQKKVTDEKFVVESSILSIPCREKKLDTGYLSDLKSQEFTSTLFELYYFMVNKHKEISIKCLQIISLLIRLSVKFFKKEDHKFSQMIFIIDGLQKIMQTHAFIFQESDVFEQTKDIFQAYCICVSKIPIGLSFTDGENLQGFWEFTVDVQNITKIAIERGNIQCLELLLEFWCGYDYFLGHDGAQNQEQLRNLVEKILKQFIKSTTEIISSTKDDSDFEDMLDTYQHVIQQFGQLSNTWYIFKNVLIWFNNNNYNTNRIDQIEEILMKKITDIFEQQAQAQAHIMRKLNKDTELNNKTKNIYYQMYWSYNIKEELQMTNKHYELDSKEEIKEDIDILYQAFESFGKLFQIVLTLFKQKEEDSLPQFLQDLILEILIFLIDYVLAFKNHINFDYLCIIIKFTDLLELQSYFYLNDIIIYFLDQFSSINNDQSVKSFQKVLHSIASNLKATEQGVQIGCFPFDLKGFFQSSTFKKHKESTFDGLSAKQIQSIYEDLFIIVDRHQQYKKLSVQNDFSYLVEKLTSQKLCEDSQIESQPKRQSTASQKQIIKSERNSSLSRLSNKENSFVQEQNEDDIVEIYTPMRLSNRVVFSEKSNQQKKVSQSFSQSQEIDYFTQFMNILSFRIQLDEQISVIQQKMILKNVLNQLIGIVKSTTMNTYTRLVQFILTNNIFYSIKQVIKQQNELNVEEINISLKFISELASIRIYLSPDIQELLLKEIVEIIIETQQRILNKQFQQNITKESDEWLLLILPLSYQYRIIFNLLQQNQLNLKQIDSQMIISNMFHCLAVITPEKMSQYHKKLYWIYRSIHILSQLHFEVFLFLQPLEFHSVTQIMEEALKVSFDSEEPMEFFINVLNQIFICKQTNNITMNQYLAYSEETLIKVLQVIALKVSRNEDLNQKNLFKLMLGYYWMLEKEKFISTINKVFENYSQLNIDNLNKFMKYVDEIEILDIRKYQYQEQLVELDAKIIFKKIFG